MRRPRQFGPGANMYWWFGIVENNDDSTIGDGLRLGRVQVRLIGLHSSELVENNATGEGIPKKDLLWAHPILPVTEPGISGIGKHANLQSGSTVFGFARDGEACQDLFVIGSVPNVPKQRRAPNKGFGGKYPSTNHHKKNPGSLPADSTVDTTGEDTDYVGEWDMGDGENGFYGDSGGFTSYTPGEDSVLSKSFSQSHPDWEEGGGVDLHSDVPTDGA